jgi:hypothetical protein
MTNSHHIEIIGADELQRALTDAPETIDRAIDVASDEAAGVLGQAFWHETHVVSGDLRRANELIAGPGFRVTLVNFMPYASIEDDRHHFVERSVERGERDVLREYEAAIDQAVDEIEGD